MSMTKIIFQHDLPADCCCSICEQALREPIRLNCGHFYCKVCLEKINQKIFNCAVCQSEINRDLCEYDKEKHRQIQLLPIFCSNQLSGCDWKGNLNQLSSHLLICRHQPIKCSNCQRFFSSSLLERHQKKCNNERAICTFCNKSIRDSDMERHLKTCPLVIMSCPFQCGLQDRTRAEIELHRATCANAENVCPFVPFGCTFAGDKQLIQQHLSDEPVRHLLLLCDQIADLKTTYQMMEHDIAMVNKRQEQIISSAEMCGEMFGAQLIWKIDNHQQKINEAKSGATTTIFSSPFMSHRFGYKMMASACLFGDGSSAGKSLSLYVLILRGEYDATLEWPFNRTVKISLLDQNPIPEERVNITYLIDPRKLRADEKFLARPRGERNAAFGSQAFCSLEIAQQYVKENTIYVKIEIDRCETMNSIIINREEDKMRHIENLRAESEASFKKSEKLRVVPVSNVNGQV